MTLMGASLGGAIALDFAHEFPEAVKKLVLIDAQGFIDGSGPGASLPGPLAKLGISVLGSKVRLSSRRSLPLPVQLRFDFDCYFDNHSSTSCAKALAHFLVCNLHCPIQLE